MVTDTDDTGTLWERLAEAAAQFEEVSRARPAGIDGSEDARGWQVMYDLALARMNEMYEELHGVMHSRQQEVPPSPEAPQSGAYIQTPVST